MNLAKSLLAEEFSEIHDTPKYLLRKLGYKYLPSEIITRKKVGFPVPLTSWFSNLENISIDYLSNAEWLKPGILEKLLKQSKNEVRSGQILWMFINIEMFRRLYFNKSWKW